MTSETDLSRLLKQSIDTAKSKSPLSREQIDQYHQETLERLKTFNGAHDILPFESALRQEWLLLAFQELVRDAWPFMVASQTGCLGVRKEVCEEWLSVHARIIRKRPAE